MEQQEVTVSTGVKFRLRRPSSHAILTRQREMAALTPKPPTLFNEGKGREEENPNDPDYLAAVFKHISKSGEALYDVLICTGSEVVDKPEGLMSEDSEEFLGLLRAMGIEAGATKIERYLQWVKVVATPHPTDWSILMTPLMRLSGETEEDVAEAVASFPGHEEQPAHNGTRVKGRGGDRHRVRSTGPRASP